MFDPGPHFGLGTIFRPLDLIDAAAVAVAAIDKILGLWCVLPDHRPPGALALITPHGGLWLRSPCGASCKSGIKQTGVSDWRMASLATIPQSTSPARKDLASATGPITLVAASLVIVWFELFCRRCP
jgi:hypothetical protein